MVVEQMEGFHEEMELSGVHVELELKKSTCPGNNYSYTFRYDTSIAKGFGSSSTDK